MAFEPTPEQKNLLEHDPDADGVLLAGPGTGKSATVVAYVEQLSNRDEPPRVSSRHCQRPRYWPRSDGIRESKAAWRPRPLVTTERHPQAARCVLPMAGIF